MTDSTRAWFRELQDGIWEAKRGLRNVGWFQEEYTFYQESRRLSLSEWARLVDVLQDERPITEMVNTSFGFGCGMRVYDDPVDPVYPGIPQEVPPVLLLVTKDHLPLDGRTEVVSTLKGKEVRPADRTSFEDGWVAFSPHTHTEENAARLKEAGLPAPRSKGHYEY